MSANALLLAGAWVVHHGQGLFYFTHNLLGLLLMALFFKSLGWAGWTKGFGLLLLLGMGAR